MTTQEDALLPPDVVIARYDHGGARVYREKPDGGRDLIMDLYACDGADPAARREAILAALTPPVGQAADVELDAAIRRVDQWLRFMAGSYGGSGHYDKDLSNLYRSTAGLIAHLRTDPRAALAPTLQAPASQEVEQVAVHSLELAETHADHVHTANHLRTVAALLRRLDAERGELKWLADGRGEFVTALAAENIALRAAPQAEKLKELNWACIKAARHREGLKEALASFEAALSTLPTDAAVGEKGQ